MTKRSRLGILGAVLLVAAGAWIGLVAMERSSYDRPYSRVEDGLWIGRAVSRPPAGTRAVVNLCRREDPYKLEASLWEPVMEAGKDPDLAWLGRVVGFIDTQRRAGQPTYVHCLAGMNRSGTAVAAYLMYEHRWGRDEAVAFLRKKRPQVQPHPTMMSLLAEWEQSLGKGQSPEP